MTTTAWRDQAWFLRSAASHGWDVLAQQGNIIIARGDEQVEIEIGSAGIPRRIKRTSPDGTVSTTSQSYIRMTDVLRWLPKNEGIKDDE
jgi:hypothetical protein